MRLPRKKIEIISVVFGAMCLGVGVVLFFNMWFNFYMPYFIAMIIFCILSIIFFSLGDIGPKNRTKNLNAILLSFPRISMQDLGSRVGITYKHAEKMTMHLVASGKIKGYIDPNTNEFISGIIKQSLNTNPQYQSNSPSQPEIKQLMNDWTPGDPNLDGGETGIQKLEKMMKVTNSIEISRMAKVLRMAEDVLWDKIFDWAEKFNFKIEKNDIIFSGGNTSGFIDEVDKYFGKWDDSVGSKDGKI